jgi:hypothetical protein
MALAAFDAEADIGTIADPLRGVDPFVRQRRHSEAGVDVAGSSLFVRQDLVDRFYAAAVQAGHGKAQGTLHAQGLQLPAQAAFESIVGTD